MKEFDIDALRQSVKGRLDEYRFSHTLGVERMAVTLGDIYLPERVDELRCAALLHDITKNECAEKQLQYCREFDIIVRDSDKISTKLLHAKTGAEVIKKEYPAYALDDIVSAVRWHTTGRDGMSLFEAVIYLADYIEDTRTFDDCVRLREYFFSRDAKTMSADDRLLHLQRTLVLSVDLTLENLISESSFIDEDTVGFRNYLLGEIGIKERRIK